MDAIKLTKCTCKKCKHEWHPRKPIKPAVCPKCKNPRWDR